MESRGRLTAMTVTILAGCFFCGGVLWICGGHVLPGKLLVAIGIYLAAAIPAGLAFGRRYDKVFLLSISTILKL